MSDPISLNRYMNHRPNCPGAMNCTCGLQEALLYLDESIEELERLRLQKEALEKKLKERKDGSE